AVTLDILANCLRLVQFLYAYNFMTIKWWARFQQTKADWSLFHAGNILSSISLSLLGASFFLLETFHDEGVGEEYAWAMRALFRITNICELIMVFSGYGAFFTIFWIASLAVATRWSYLFEPLLESWSPELHSRDINSDILPELPVDDASLKDQRYGPSDATQYMPTGSMQYSQDPRATANVSELPTSYDYSQMTQQVRNDNEMGVVGTSY
ncbi:multi-pass transmembrane protein, partial [Cardiosporidium cionae]